MSGRDRQVEETLPAEERAAEERAAEQATRSSACARPRRYGLATRMEKAQAFAGLFGEPAEQVRVDHFELRQYLGGGGMGEVYVAYDQHLERDVALKMVRADRLSRQADERLLREARLQAKLSHPNVVPVYESGEFEGRVFLAMELIRGRSLRIWLQEHDALQGRARVREVLRRFVAAGRGLQAAHGAGLVHRDFKPDNVLVGDDGRVQVMDFGLARPVTDLVVAASPARSDPAGALWLDDETLTADHRGGGWQPQRRRSGRVLTTHGRILGTPRYMSPEQMRGADADHRSDQFSFCVALYEALYEQMPFTGAGFPALLQAVQRGQIAESARGSAVPAAVRKAIRRGLAAEPGARFPDMGALLDVLDKWQHPSRRWAVAAVIAGTAMAGGILFYLTPPEPCSDAGAPVAELWTLARRDAIRDAFIGTGLSYAAASWSTLDHGLDRYARRLENEMVTTCEATHVHDVQSTELLDLRMLCLTSRQRRLGALIEQLEHADASVVERAQTAASALPDLATCQHAGTLLHGMQAPAPELKAEVADIRDHLAQARTQELLGKSDEALRIAREQLERPTAVSYGPVQAEALYQAGRVLAYRGTPEEREEGEAMLLRAGNLAESERHDELVAEIWNLLALSADRNHPGTGQARQWYERTDAVIRRIGDPPLQRAAALRNLARIHLREGKLAEAEAAQREALDKLESASEVSWLDPPAYQHDLAVILQQRDRQQEAQELLGRALARYIEVLGATHPYVANVRFSIANLHVARGDSALARPLFNDVLRVHAEALGENHPLVGKTHFALAELERQSGALDRARTHAMKGLALYQRAYGEGHVNTASLYTCLGAIEFRRGALDKALAAFEAALAIRVRHLDATHIDVGVEHLNIAETWTAQGRHDQALASLAHAEPILQPYLKEVPSLAPLLASVRGRAHLGKGELEAAVATLESAVQGFRALPGDPMRMELADAGWALVQASSQIGREEDPRALALAREALAIYEQQGPEVHTPRHAVQRWLDAHDGRQQR